MNNILNPSNKFLDFEKSIDPSEYKEKKIEKNARFRPYFIQIDPKCAQTEFFDFFKHNQTNGIKTRGRETFRFYCIKRIYSTVFEKAQTICLSDQYLVNLD